MLKILGRVLVAVGLILYIAVALVNYSVVQSYLGTAVGHHFSREWGGEVHIGALHAMPWDHLILNDVLLIDPTGDTILDVARLRVSFRHFPFKNNSLSLDHVYLRDGYYYFATTLVEDGSRRVTNLQYIFDYYQNKPKRFFSAASLTVSANTLTLRNVHYKMDLANPHPQVPHEGVVIHHMEFFNIHGRLKHIRVVNDDVSCQLQRLRTIEKSGFVADNIAGDVHVSRYNILVHNFEARTPQSIVSADVEITYNGWQSMNDYLNNVRHSVVLHEGTTVAISDIAYWAPSLWGTDAQIAAEGEVVGTINNIAADLTIQWGEQSDLLFAGWMKDVEHIDSTHFDVDIERLRTCHADLLPLLQALSAKPAMTTLAQELDHIELSGQVHGGRHEASTANLHLYTGLGNLQADATISPLGDHGLRFDIDGSSDGIGLKMLQSEWISHTGFDVSVSGRWGDVRKSGTLQAELLGELTNSVVRGYQLTPISVEGVVNNGRGKLQVLSSDSLAHLALAADFNLRDSIQRLSGHLNVEHLDLATFGLMPEQYGQLRSHATLQLEGQNIDNLDGKVMLSDIRLGILQMEHLSLSTAAHRGDKTLQLRSDPLDATVNGHFDYNELPLMVRHFCHATLPADMVTLEKLCEDEETAIADNTLNFHLYWKDDGHFLHTLNEKLTVSKNSRIDGSYNNGELMKAVLRSDSMRFGGILLENIGLSSHATGNDYLVEVEAQDVNIGAINLLQRTTLTLNSNPSRALAGLVWGTSDTRSHGDLMLRLRKGQISVLRPEFTIDNDEWRLEIDSLSLATDSTTRLEGHGITLRSKEQSVEAGLRLAGQDNDRVELLFDNFSLDDLSSILLQETPVSVDGAINGRFSLYGLTQTPYFNANLQVNNCVVNRQPLGNVRLRSNWNAELDMLNLELDGDQLTAAGWMELGTPEQEINFNVDFNRFDLGLVAPLMNSFANRFEGHLHGNFDITGTLSKPVIIGEALVENGALGIDMTGVTYFFNDSIRFHDKRIALDGFRLRDPRNNTATVDGEIRYDGLDDIHLDLQMHTDNLLMLDRYRDEGFSGTLLASANSTVEGRIDSLKVYVHARTNSGSRLTVPVSNQRQVKAQNYITFVGDDETTSTAQHTTARRPEVSLEMDLEITPDVQLNLPMDFSDATVKVSGNGNGELHITLDGEEFPQVLGSYEIVAGTMKLGLLSLIEKTFTIESGSSLGFQGNLPDARFDLRAVYSQRVNLSTLTGSPSEVSGGQKYLQVEDVIAIAGTLQDPTISFDIRLPNADASVEEEVFAYIDRKSERDMLNQTMSLLVLGQFYNANASAPNVNGNIAASGGTGALSSILSDMVQVVDINVDYKAANEVTRDQLDVNISKDWGRWYLESTLGYGGESQELETGNTNSAVIDALVGYRISPLVHLFAYNRTNTNDYTRMDLPYKQGVGLKLTKDFDHWGELIRRKKKMKTP